MLFPFSLNPGQLCDNPKKNYLSIWNISLSYIHQIILPENLS